jgi:pimeloyl-ACP methyl ester carboxylesterase/class 3 adenylate cyclase
LDVEPSADKVLAESLTQTETPDMESPETRWAMSGDVSIAYQVIGDGSFDVVFVPSISHVELAWTVPDLPHGQIPRRLASFARLIFFDRRGMGMSDRLSGAPTLEARMDDIRAVMDAAGSARAALFGHIDGAPLSLVFAATYPERVSALVLLGAFARRMWAPDYPWGLTDEQFRAANEIFMRVFFGPREEAVDALRLIRGHGPDDEELRRDVEFTRRACGSPNTWRAYLDLYRDFDVRHVLPAIRVPTLLIHGAEAGSVMPVAGARYIAQQIRGARLLELPGESQVPSRAALSRTLDETEVFLGEVWESGGWEEPEADRVLATVLFTDIVGSSQRATELGDRVWRELLQRHHELVRRQLIRFRGDEVDTAGDGFLASFDGPARAIRCAQAIVEGVGALGLEVRAGLHTGECEVLDGKVAGIAVHTGARVASRAAASEVLVSSTVKDLVAGSGIAFEDRGTHELHGVPGEWRLYAARIG